jgi:threonine/homoserine/homoserine lactone efflux protein
LTLTIFGGIVIILFGLSTLLGVFGISFMPHFSLATGEPDNILMHTMMMTLSNPLTILFWTGVFSARVAEDKMKQEDMVLFGLGAVLSTLIFLSTISLVGSRISLLVIDSLALGFLNAAVGVILIGFGMRVLSQKRMNQGTTASQGNE